MRAMGTLMIQGTTSNAGKSTVAAALCRMLANAGVNVAPFKPQNMALNSAVSVEGGEIARAQAVQAVACRIPPQTDMNPILLKPNAKLGSQVIINGKVFGNLDANAYHALKPNLLKEVVSAYHRLKNRYDVVIVEGAGSPVEINLRQNDIANMGFAEAIDCSVLLVVDIDRGGAFAHVVGTLELMSESERERVVGIIINRFRGDISLLKPGLDWLEQKTNKPVLAVIPYLNDFYLEAEDAPERNKIKKSDAKINVIVPAYPRMSNHTDFDALRLHPQVDFAFVNHAKNEQAADLIILPGSKSVRDDFCWLQKNGWEDEIKRHLRYGGKLLGICGGFQMLGQKIDDPLAIESATLSSPMLGVLEMSTRLNISKTLLKVDGNFLDSHDESKKKIRVSGYEIHAGISMGPALDRPLLDLNDKFDGAISSDNQIWGTYVHGIFDTTEALQHILNWVKADDFASLDRAAALDAEIAMLANTIESVLSVKQLNRLLQSA